ncbi:MAG: hypothetical protein IMZ53_00370 [Thermoplasmata archaeon]|nr:hypothetical protein [Thermoplasmata archaeon]
MKQFKETLYGLRFKEGGIVLIGHDSRPITWTTKAEAKKASNENWIVVEVTKTITYKVEKK